MRGSGEILSEDTIAALTAPECRLPGAETDPKDTAAAWDLLSEQWQRVRQEIATYDTERLREVAPEGPSDADLERIPLRRTGAPSEVADVVCFLASERGGYVTGTTIAVDGGMGRSLL